MPKIATINSDVFQYGTADYPKGVFMPQYRTVGGKLSVRLKSLESNDYIEQSNRYIPWDEFTDSNDAAYASAAAFTIALANIIVKATGSDTVAGDKGTVTQATNATTAVTINNLNGVITTVAQTLAADTEITFTVNNSKVTTASNVMLTVTYPAASAGTPVAQIGTLANGSFTVVLTNVNPSNALNAAVKIGFIVL